MKCPKCRTDVPVGAMQCPGCGQKFVAAKRCPHCGSTIQASATVCPQCKQAVGGAPARSTFDSASKRQSSFRWWRIPIYILVLMLGTGIGIVAGPHIRQNLSIPALASSVESLEASSISSASQVDLISQTETVNLDGEWEQPHSETDGGYQAATIMGDAIEIYWIDPVGNTRSLYWAGNIVIPDGAGNNFIWESQNDTAKTSGAILASSDSTKMFEYKDGEIRYEASVMGTTATMQLRKISDTVSSPIETNIGKPIPEQGTVNGVEISILSARQVTDYEGRNAILVKFGFSNPSPENTSFILATSVKAFQNGMELELASLYGVPDYDASNYMREIRDGAYLEVESGFVLSDNISDIEVEVFPLAGRGTPTLKKTFSINDLQ